MMNVIDTERLRLRWIKREDAPFILELLNDPSWLEYLGDRQIRTIDQAEEYISSIVEMYEKHGFGLYLVELKMDGTPIGICGLIKRISLEYVDIGFAFISKFQRNGYGYEAASATLKYGHEHLGLKRIVAITSEKNYKSAQLLEKIGMKFEQMVLLPHEKEELKLFLIDF